VTTLRPSGQQALLAQAVDYLSEVGLSSGATVRAWRTRRSIAGRERETVVVFSQQLFEGQVRGLHQHLKRCAEQLEQVGLRPRGTAESVKRRVGKILWPPISAQSGAL